MLVVLVGVATKAPKSLDEVRRDSCASVYDELRTAEGRSVLSKWPLLHCLCEDAPLNVTSLEFWFDG